MFCAVLAKAVAILFLVYALTNAHSVLYGAMALVSFLEIAASKMLTYYRASDALGGVRAPRLGVSTCTSQARRPLGNRRLFYRKRLRPSCAQETRAFFSEAFAP